MGLPYIDGGTGNDQILGSKFADDLRGGANDDMLGGFAGPDSLTGGTGSDTFVFSPGDEADVIKDYTGSFDKIALKDWTTIADYAELRTKMSASGATLQDVTIDFGNGDELTIILRTTIAFLDSHQSDFTFR